MKRLISVSPVLALALLSAAALAGDAAQPTVLTGWITDSYCGAKNANSDGQQCAKDCFGKGAKLELLADGRTYQISDQKAAAHLGHEVVVTGTVDKNTIK